MIRIRIKRTSTPFDLDSALTTIVDEFARVGERETQKLLSGNTSKAQLRREGNPYARKAAKGKRRGAQRGSAPRLPINHQSGDLWNHLYIPQHRFGFSIQFPDTRSAFVLSPQGTSRMVARGFWPALRKALLPQLRKAARDVVPQAIARGR